MKRRGQPPKKESVRKMITVKVRCTEWFKNEVKGKARFYAGGNLSLFIDHCIEWHEPAMIDTLKETSKVNRDAWIIFRTTRRKWNWLVGKSKIYAGGNHSKWLRHVLRNYEPRMLRAQK